MDFRFRHHHHTDSFAEQENDDVEEKVDNINLCDDEGEAVVFDSETSALITLNLHKLS